MLSIATRALSPLGVLGVVTLIASSAGPARADWSQRFPQNSPEGRSMHAIASDEEEGELVLYGGTTTSPVGDTWTWDGDDWRRQHPSHSPGPRTGHAMAWFAGRHRVLFFGGQDPTLVDQDDTWEWSGEDWERVPAINAPGPRHFHAVAYDTARGRLVLFGGRNGTNTFGDTWEFDGQSWTRRLPTTSPPARYRHAMAYDEVRHVVVMFGGSDASDAPLGDTWEWNGTNWARRNSSASPSPRYGHAMCYDAEREKVELYGGRGATKDLADAWEWDGVNWVQRPIPPGPVARRHHAMAYDRVAHRLVVFGGSGSRRDHWELSPVDSSSEIATGSGAGGNGYVDLFGGPLTGMRPIGLRRIPWEPYDQAVGQTRPAAGNVDGDPWDELVVGLGPYPTSGGYFIVMDDGLHAHRVLRWLRVPWPAYNQAEGSTRPACGDLDGDGKDEIVVGLGPFTTNGGNFAVFGNSTSSFAFRRWGRVRWQAYDTANGETRPTCGDIDGDGKDEIVVGLGRYATTGGWTFMYDDLVAGLAYVRMVRLDWSEYNAANGETWPACGNMDGDDADEVLLGIGRFPTLGGRCRVLDDAAANHAGLAWLDVGWGAYRDENGEVHPATGELDGTVGEEVVLGLGRFPAQGGYFTVFDATGDRFIRLTWGRVTRTAYNTANGETFPTVGKLR